MRSLGPYALIKKLGQGGMAEVFLATAFGASGFEKKVVIKALLPELAGEAQYQRMFIEEARLHARLTHRNIVQVHELGVADGAYFVRMEWVDGESLEALLGAGPPPVELALLVAEEIALALDYVHRVTDEAGRPLGLVHRDVSPSNVLISREGEVKLADFGIAKATLLRDVTRSGVIKGKYGYMSPEQISGLPLGPQSDQFGLGVTFLELLGRPRPFDGATPLETMDRVREAAPPDLSGLPADLAAIVLRCLSRRAEDRFPTAEAARRAIAEVRRTRAAPPDLAAWVSAGAAR